MKNLLLISSHPFLKENNLQKPEENLNKNKLEIKLNKTTKN